MPEGKEVAEPQVDQPAAPEEKLPAEAPTPLPEAREMTAEEKADWDLEQRVGDIVSYHKPTDLEIAQIANVRYFTKQFIIAIVKNCPASPDRSAAIRKAREAMMTANAAIVVPGARLPL